MGTWKSQKAWRLRNTEGWLRILEGKRTEKVERGWEEGEREGK